MAGDELVKSVTKGVANDEALELAQQSRDYTEFLRLFRLMKTNNDGVEPYDFIQAPSIATK